MASMSTPNDRPERQRTRPTREQTRDRLLTAASSVFAERGYDGASLDHVAAAAGLTKGAVYSNFGSKEDLFYALMQQRIGERLDLVAKAAGQHQTIDQIGADVGGGLRDLLTSQRDWQLLFIEFWAQAIRNDDLLRDFTEQRRRVRKLLGSIIDAVADQLGISVPLASDQLAAIVLGLANGLAMEQIADPEELDESLLAEGVRLLLRGMASDAGPDLPPGLDGATAAAA